MTIKFKISIGLIVLFTIINFILLSTFQVNSTALIINQLELERNMKGVFYIVENYTWLIPTVVYSILVTTLISLFFKK